MKNNTAKKTAVQEPDSSLAADFKRLTNGIQKILDIGAASLAEAEAKTAKVAKLDAESEQYIKIVAEIKAAQAKAGHAFKQAEELISATNELMPKKETPKVAPKKK